MSIISASKVGGGLANISSEGGMKFNIVIYIFCTAFYLIDSHCIQVKLKNLKSKSYNFRDTVEILAPDSHSYIWTMRLHYRPGGFSKIPSRWGYFYADRGLSQTSAQASPRRRFYPPQTRRDPTTKPPSYL